MKTSFSLNEPLFQPPDKDENDETIKQKNKKKLLTYMLISI